MPDGESSASPSSSPVRAARPPGTLAAPPLEIDVIEESEAWRGALGAPDARIEGAVRAALRAAGTRVPRARTLELCVVLADDDFVRGFNRAYRGKDKPTNVLSFPSGLAVLEGCDTRALGDIVLAFETVRAEAAAEGKTLAAHLSHLVVHGALHLVGFTHEADDAAQAMAAAEIEALAGLGIADPYAPRGARP